MRERRFGDGARVLDRREVGGEDDWRHLQAQRFSGSSESERYGSSGSADRYGDRRRDGNDRGRDERLWNQLLEKKNSNGTVLNSNMNSGYSNRDLNSGYNNTLNLNPNDLGCNGDVNSIPDSRYLDVGGGYGSDTHGIVNGINIEQSYQRNGCLDMTDLPKHLPMDNDRTRTHHLHFDDRALHREEKPVYYTVHSSTHGTPSSKVTYMPLNNSRGESYGVVEGGPSDGIRRPSGMLTETSLGDGYRQNSHFVSPLNSELQLERSDEIRRPNGMLIKTTCGDGYRQTLHFVSPSKTELQLERSDGIRRPNGMLTEATGGDGYRQNSHFVLPSNSELQLDRFDGIRRPSGMLTEATRGDGYRQNSHFVLPSNSELQLERSDGIRRPGGMLTEATGGDGYRQNTHFVLPSNSELQLDRFDGIRRPSGMLTEATRGDGYRQTSHFVSPANSELQLERWNQRRALLSPAKEMNPAYAYPEMQRSERNDIGMPSNGRSYNNITNGRENCESREFPVTGVMDTTVDTIYGTRRPVRGGSRESTQLHHNIRLQGNEYIDGNNGSYAMDQCENTDEDIGSYTMDQYGNILDSRRIHTEFETEVHIDNESLQEDYNPKRDSDAWFYGDRSLFPDDDQDMYESGGIPHQMLMPEELDMQDMSQNMRTGNHATGKKAIRHEQNIQPYKKWGACHNKFHGRSCGDGQWADGVSDQAYYDYMPSSLIAPTPMQGPSSRFRSTSRDVKNRLGSHGRDVKNRLGPAHRDIKKRLGPVCKDTKKHTVPAGKFNLKHPSRNAHIQLPSPRKSIHCRGSDTLPVGDSSEAEGKHGNSISSEDSEEFKLLVHGTFLKFVKLLNENSAHRRRYMEQGGTGILKCGICGSNSKEFVDTRSLAEHALTSCKAGSQAEHVGFHKALCALMGWSSSAASEGHFSPKSLTEAEATALKEDLIIWPPTVVIHNSSIANKVPTERMIVSIEDLKAILKGNGFDTEKTKVCRGKPANQSIMVVTFPGTLSGLHEAERLHKLYAENKHGRAELLVKCTSNDEEAKAKAERMEDVLFGYLGVAGDLDKLDFETKKRCVVKSKEGQVMAGATE